MAAEDKSTGWQVFAVCDGHGGRGVVNRLAALLGPTVLAALARASVAGGGAPLRPGYLRQYLKRIVLWLDRKLHEEVQGRARSSGSTLILLVYNPRSRQIAVANVGDSRAVIQLVPPAPDPGSPSAAPVSKIEGELIETRDHKPTDRDEMERVAAAGSYVLRKRVAGILAMTRAMGDFSLKTTSAQRGGMYDPLLAPVSALADVQVGALGPGVSALAVLGCDGIWDVMQSREAVAIVRAALKEGSQPAKTLVDQAYARGSSDNITALVVRTRPAPSSFSTSHVAPELPALVAGVVTARASGTRVGAAAEQPQAAARLPAKRKGRVKQGGASLPEGRRSSTGRGRPTTGREGGGR